MKVPFHAPRGGADAPGVPSRRWLVWVALLVWVGPPPVAAASSPDPSIEQVLLLGHAEDPAAFEQLSPERRHAIGVALCDSAGVEQALAADGWPPAVRAWLRARARLAAGDTLGAASAIAPLARPTAHDQGTLAEPGEVLRAMDRDRVLLALAGGDTAAARAALASPWAPAAGDARWQACLGAWELATGRARAAASSLEAAWIDADDGARRDAVFAQRALARLAAGDSLAAAQAWLDWVRVLRQPVERNAALRVWDAHPRLRAAVDQPGVRLNAARWLARVARREAALALARSAWTGGDGSERAGGFVEVAEQLYRLRRHEELAAHLRQPRPAGLDTEQRAALDAYPWGVARREGATIRVARGFDEVASAHAGTDRAAEALWEGAWVWELADRPSTAEQRFVRYLQRYPQAPFADGAAMRVVWLPFWRGEPEVALQRLGQHSSLLRGGVEEATALWVGARACEALGDTSGARKWRERLLDRHAHSPFVESPAEWLDRPPVAGAEDPARTRAFAALFDRQAKALRRVAIAAAAERSARQTPESLAGVERLLELGIFEEGDRRLLAWPELRGRDPAALVSAVAVAWRCGRPEVQARLATLLSDRLGASQPELRTDLDILAFPTPYAGAVLEVAAELQVSPWLLWGLMRRESFFDTQAVSLAGARGLMQLMPATAGMAAKELGVPTPTPTALLRPLTNLRLGGAILAGLLRRYHGDPFAALAGYNAGEVNAERWAARMQPGRPPAEVIPLVSYAETRQYVFQVLRHGGVYAASYGEPLPPGLPGSSR